jgi:sulfoxide reductase heme-binding subunit YedZ
MLTLAITPLRQATQQPVFIRFRRMLGLYTFFYATMHLTAYLVLDLRGYWAQIFEEIAKRPYITVGFTAWLLLVPLAITSTQAAIRRLGRNWARLHKLVYAVGVLAVLHFWWLVKSDVREPALYAAILAALLGWRIVKTLRDRRANMRRRATTT